MGASRFPLRWMLGLFLAALLLRAGLGVVQLARADDPNVLEFPDEQQYWSMATAHRAGEGLPDELGFQATRMPFFPWALSLVTRFDHGVITAKVVQWGIGALAAALVAGLATAMFDRRVGLTAGTLVAVDPFHVFFSSLLLTETAFVSALCALWWAAWPVFREGSVSPRRWLAVAALSILCVYLRESTLGLIAIILLIAAGRAIRERAVPVGPILVGLAIVLALTPWAARNRRVTGEWTWLTTRGGISLYDGVGPQADGTSDLGDIKQMPAVAGLSEVEWNRYFVRESIAAIKADPGRIAKLAAVKLGRLWNPVPNAGDYRSLAVRVVAAAWSVPVFLLAAFGVVFLATSDRSRRRWLLLYLMLPAIYLSALHSLFVGSVRYRLGAMPMLELLAAFAVVMLWDRVRIQRSQT